MGCSLHLGTNSELEMKNKKNNMRTIIIVFSLFACSRAFAQPGWIMQQSGTIKNLRSISTYDGVNAVVVGVNGTVVTTDNSGMRWTLQEKPVSQNLNGVTSISVKILIAVGPKDSIYRSTDHGTTWRGYRSKVRGECFTIASVNELTSIDFDTSNKVCVVAGDREEVIFSEDSGLQWVERFPSPNEEINLHGVSSIKGMIFTVGDTLGIGAKTPGTGYSRILTSKDEGDTWDKHSTNLPGVSPFGSGISFYGCNARTGIIVGNRGAIFHSANKGQTWDSIPSWTKANLKAVSFADEINGFAVGDSGVILVTRDGGYNWLPQVSPTKKNLRSVSMSDPFHGFICGDSGIILYTQDGGFTAGVNTGNKVFLNIQNYPNPFPSRTAIHIDLPLAGHITVSIYNLLGVEIAKIADADFDAGSHNFEWNAVDIPSGIYVCRLVADGKSVVSQMIVTK